MVRLDSEIKAGTARSRRREFRIGAVAESLRLPPLSSARKWSRLRLVCCAGEEGGALSLVKKHCHALTSPCLVCQVRVTPLCNILQVEQQPAGVASLKISCAPPTPPPSPQEEVAVYAPSEVVSESSAASGKAPAQSEKRRDESLQVGSGAGQCTAGNAPLHDKLAVTQQHPGGSPPIAEHPRAQEHTVARTVFGDRIAPAAAKSPCPPADRTDADSAAGVRMNQAHVACADASLKGMLSSAKPDGGDSSRSSSYSSSCSGISSSSSSMAVKVVNKTPKRPSPTPSVSGGMQQQQQQQQQRQQQQQQQQQQHKRQRVQVPSSGTPQTAKKLSTPSSSATSIGGRGVVGTRTAAGGTGGPKGVPYPLKGCKVVISGIQNPERGRIREAAIKLGAMYAPDWDQSSTHLVSAFANTPKGAQVPHLIPPFSPPDIPTRICACVGMTVSKSWGLLCIKVYQKVKCCTI